MYLLAVQLIGGNQIFRFKDPADLTNFIMDIEGQVLSMALAIEGE